VRSIGFALIVVAACLAGAWVGGVLRLRLPKHHLDADTRDLLRVSMAFLSTLTGIVLGLVVASAKGSFDKRSDEVQDAATKMVLLDGQLRLLGSAALPVRELLKESLTTRIETLWGEPSDKPKLGPQSIIEGLRTMLSATPAADDSQRATLVKAIQLIEQIAQIHAMAQVQAESTVLLPLLAVIVCWLAVMSIGLNLFASRNGTVLVIDLLYALAAASAVFLILEMGHGFGGVIEVSAEPMLAALEEMKR
jgi:hypothetical protein